MVDLLPVVRRVVAVGGHSLIEPLDEAIPDPFQGEGIYLSFCSDSLAPAPAWVVICWI